MKRLFLLILILLLAGFWAGTSYATPLTDAARRGDINKVRALLNKGADVNEKDNFGWTALIEAADGGHTEITKLLIEKGANVNEKDKILGMTALMMAARAGHTETVRLLINKGADVNEKNNYGGTALIYAAYHGHTEIAKLLIEKGADVDDAILGLEGWIIQYPQDAPSFKQAIRLLERLRPK